MNTNPGPSSDPRTPPEALEQLTRTIPSPDSANGVLIGSYRLVRQLGEGGMGVVYHAQQLQPIRRDVALKIIKPGMDSKQVIARFEAERQALAMMDHGNIARVLDAGMTSAGLPYFVMELVDGVPITGYCDSGGLTARERISLFIPVCQAIQHAHQKGIIHRDIKPSNILVKQQEVGKPENQAVAKVIDFGLAKALGGQLTDSSMLTNIGTVLGTLQYMSPEQADLGRHDIDTRSDVYSLGTVLYELLTGTPPLEREHLVNASYLDVLQRIREEEARPPSAQLRLLVKGKHIEGLSQRRPARPPIRLDQELDWIVLKALEKERTRRYETANGLARDLQRYLQGEPVEAAPPSTTYRIRKFVQKHRVWLGTMAAFVAMLLAGVLVSASMAVRASRAEAEARAVNDFLQNDLLAQASLTNQQRSDNKPDSHLEVRTALDRAATRVEGKFGKQPLVEAAIRETIGDTYTGLGLYPEAQPHRERALELRVRELGGNNPATLTTMYKLALLYRLLGQYEQSETLFTKVLDAQQRVRGEEHADTVRSMSGLAWLLWSRGKYTQAEPLYEKALRIRLRTLGEEHPDTLRIMNDLAVLYWSLGEYGKEEQLLARTLKSRRRTLGDEHPDTLNTVTNMAIHYQTQGKYAQAEALYAEVLQARSRVLGEEHPDTLSGMNNLAEAYSLLGKYSQADQLFMKVLKTRRRVLGEMHPYTMTVMYNLGALYETQRKHTDAMTLFTQVLQGRRRVLGEDHPYTIDVLARIGKIHLDQRRYKEAEAVLRGALNSYERISFMKWERYNCQSMIGASLAGQKKYADAELPLISGYEGIAQRRASLPAWNQSAIVEAGERILQFYLAWGKPEKATEWRQRLAQNAPVSSEKP